MREASYVCSLLDNAAALGNADKLEQLALRWRRRTRIFPKLSTVNTLWEHAAAAAQYRAYAIRHRQAGVIARAILNESSSEGHLRCMATYGTRKSLMTTDWIMTEDNLSTYDHVIVAFSGGKDSLACLLYLLDEGVPKSKIELWHHDVDGGEGSTMMDWPVTRAYCRAVADALGVPIYYSWKVGGFEREMNRKDSPTAPICFETPVGDRTIIVKKTGGRGPAGTRGLFPQVSADLSVRWCSPYLKIDVGAAALRGQARFRGKRTLFVTGERAEESTSRARYKTFEPHRADLRDGRKPRHIDQWRPVHAWSEVEVWELIQRHRVAPHPAYVLGWGRVSCAACIFGNPDQWASLRKVNVAQFSNVARREAGMAKTIQRKKNLLQLADQGTPYGWITPERAAAATAHTFPGPVILPEGTWTLPAGAYGDSCGPT